jgi:hypothetical protein
MLEYWPDRNLPSAVYTHGAIRHAGGNGIIRWASTLPEEPAPLHSQCTHPSCVAGCDHLHTHTIANDRVKHRQHTEQKQWLEE